MQSQRIEVAGRGYGVVVAHRAVLLPAEAKAELPVTEACATLERLPSASVAALVRAFGHRFPNSLEPQKSERVMGYVIERVRSRAIAVVKTG